MKPIPQITPLAQVRQSEIPLKQWAHEEAERLRTTVTAIYNRFYRGKYPNVASTVRRVNKRVVYVAANQLVDSCQ